jgi:elongation factor 2
MIADQLPSPATAQAYRVEKLYSGPLDGPEVEWIAKCDKSAPLSMYVSKMTPAGDSGRFIAFGRVFSGCVKTGQEVRILGPEYEHGGKKDLATKKIQRVLLMMGNKCEQISDVPCGNVCGLVGVDQYILKSGTITTSESFHPFHTMKFSVSAVVQVAVEPKVASDLPKLVEGLKRLSKSDPLVKTSLSKTGQHIIAGAGELHLEICLKDLREDFLKGSEINVSEPIVSYSESVVTTTGAGGAFPEQVIAKSANKLNRLWVSAQPLSDKTIVGIEEGDIKLVGSTDMKAFGRMMADEYNWDVTEARKIWSFGCPPDAMGNAVVDCTRGVAYLTEAKSHVVSAFVQASNGGVLCDEVMRGVRFNIHEFKLHPDSVHRGAGQIMPCARKAFFGAQLASCPRILEPMYLVDISVPHVAIAGVFNTLNQKRGEIDLISDRVGTPMSQVKAFLPVAESFGFTELLRKNTGGKAFPQMTFSHWKVIDSDPLSAGTMAYTVLTETRERKGLKAELPKFTLLRQDLSSSEVSFFCVLFSRMFWVCHSGMYSPF